MMMWQPIETAPKDQFLLLCGPSGYTTTPMVVTTGRMCSDYHAGRWIDHANDDLTDWGFRPTHWAPLVLPGAQPAESIKDDIIDDLQSQFDTEGITEHDSGDALIRLYDAIAAVEDNFALAQPAPSVPEDVMRDAERYRYLRARDEGSAGVGCWIEADGRACDRGWLYGDQLDSAIDTCIEMLAAAPEAKP